MPTPRIYTAKYPSTVIRCDESFWGFLLRLNIDDTLPDKVILQEHERPERFLTYSSTAKEVGLGAAALRDVLGLSPANQPSAPPLDLSQGDNRRFPAVICFSSGTSGLPKAAVISHHNLIAYLLVARATDPTMANSEQREVFYAPLGHIYGVFMSSLPLFSGGYVRLMRDYSLHKYIRAATEVKATTLRVVPPTVVAMVKDPFVRQQDLTSVRTISCAGAVLAQDIISEVRNMMDKVEVVQGYGMTEGSITTLKRFAARRKLGSVGRLSANVQVRIVDDELEDVPEGTPGEIMFSSPTIFMGYKNNEDANAEAFPFKDGWMRTGDVGRLDSDGYLWLTDRKKDLIKYKGNQVSPAELESVLLSHPQVTEAGVCATWDRSQETEVPVGYVNFQSTVAVADHERLLKEVHDYVNERVSRAKRLRGGVFYLETFPRNHSGKLLRKDLPARRGILRAKL
ncbi:luciferin 4-monooxygenase [Coniochaeta ligniaria NRRL 30616]|uniref:Luciferin 4-monooxygenase n=1 Tax=Coniochaeta ligniaria NRRL 30616 TaxID=1408157 RepID=A0A1J7I563_9PEZI|nr:luciferin 4-monooxygenase [Coniochaeta ligniaria NRRL 30616]